MLLLACGAAQATQPEEWLQISQSPDSRVDTLIDVANILPMYDVRLAPFKQVFAPRTERSVDYPGRWISIRFMVLSFNCVQKTGRTNHVFTNYDDGFEASEPSVLQPTEWERVLPGTEASAEMKFICAWKPK